MLGFSSNLHYYICTKPVDIRNSFDGLAGIVRNFMQKNPITEGVFIFINKRRTHIKLLYWDEDGFVLYYKRLEQGVYQSNITVNAPSQELKREEVMMLLEGLSYHDMKKWRRFKIS